MTGIAFTVMGRLCVALPVNSVGFGKLCGCTFHRMAIFCTAVFCAMDPNTRLVTGGTHFCRDITRDN